MDIIVQFLNALSALNTAETVVSLRQLNWFTSAKRSQFGNWVNKWAYVRKQEKAIGYIQGGWPKN